MKLMGKRALLLLALCGLFAFGMVFMLVRYARSASAWAAYPYNRHIYTAGKLKTSGRILDRDGIVLFRTKDGKAEYNPSAGVRRACMHLTGDSERNVATGLQLKLRSDLIGWNALSGVYSRKGSGRDVAATVDAGLCREALNALDGRKGVVAIMNYKTGEIICMVSSPTFDPSDPPDISANPGKYDGVYINRFLSSTYVPGSVFKLVTAAAALDCLPGVSGRVFECAGALQLDGGEVTCPKAHGSQSFEKALSNSCNCVFAQLTLEIGASRIERYAESAGFNTSIEVDGTTCAKGSFTADGATEAELGWAGVGQYRDMANPAAFLRFVASIANGGKAVQPHLLKLFGPALPQGSMMPRGVANDLKDMMRFSVTDNYGEKGLEGYDLCAKSGTAQLGGDSKPHAWFAGFLSSGDAPLAFVVIVENGGAGSSAGRSVAVAALKYAVGLEY